MAAVHERHAGAGPRQIAGSHGAGGTGPGDDCVKGSHYLQVTATKYGDQAS